jgi:hypothetical protein
MSYELGRRLFGILEKTFYQTEHRSVWLKKSSCKGREMSAIGQGRNSVFAEIARCNLRGRRQFGLHKQESHN